MFRKSLQTFMNTAGLPRASPSFCTTLQESLTKAQSIWNLDFGGSPTTDKLTFYNEKKTSSAPLFHVLDLDGTVVNPDEEPQVSKELLIKMIETMLRQQTLDNIFLEAHRQGRISFYLTSFCEEATIVGTAAALRDRDELFMQYREAAALSFRGYTIAEMVAQCMGNIENELKGRQMPIHYGSRRLHTHMVSSSTATQIPHAAGAGYALRLENERETDPSSARIAAVFFGEGAASGGDFHAALNFASTVGSNTLFVVRNNGYAISTPTASQYAGDGILARGIGYGIPSARVDGHDILAVLQTMQRAREIIRKTNRPVLVEAILYRASHHSSSDDSALYRPQKEMEEFSTVFSPIARFEKYLVKKGLWGPEDAKNFVRKVRQETIDELRRQEKLPNWPISSMHDDVYKEMTPEMRQAQKELEEHYERNKHAYKI